MHKERKGIAERISETFEIPAESFGALSRVTVTGNTTVQIEGHRGLLELTDDTVADRCRGTVVRITGTGLKLHGMNGDCIAFTGRIAGIDFGG